MLSGWFGPIAHPTQNLTDRQKDRKIWVLGAATKRTQIFLSISIKFCDPRCIDHNGQLTPIRIARRCDRNRERRVLGRSSIPRPITKNLLPEVEVSPSFRASLSGACAIAHAHADHSV